jgi:Late embryogenesis abundant (LEA) group 1
MQAGKNAMEAAKEKAANIGASAKAGMDKTKAVLEEKVTVSLNSHTHTN